MFVIVDLREGRKGKESDGASTMYPIYITTFNNIYNICEGRGYKDMY
jgi:hypothetical protein